MNNKLVIYDGFQGAQWLASLSGDAFPISLEWKPYKESRSLSQNALMWMWNTEVVTQLKAKWPRQYEGWTPETIHDLQKHTFLGYEDKVMIDIVTKERTTKSVLKSTTNLDTGEMTFFMDLVYQYWAEKGIFLSIPESCEYQKLREYQNGQ